MTSLYATILLLSLTGLMGTVYILLHKKPNKNSPGLLGQEGQRLVNGYYSHFFGIPIEFLGLAFYTALATFSGFLTFIPYLRYPTVFLFLLTISAFGFLFTCYLTAIQIVVLKTHRQSFLPFIISLSAILIFALLISQSPYDFQKLFLEHKLPILILHVMGVELGLGGATMADIFFFKFLRNLKISRFEGSILNTLSQVIWVALAILIISGIGLYMIRPEELQHSTKFLVKVVAVCVIVINGLFITLVTSPQMIRISTFGKDHVHSKSDLKNDRKLIFATGAISFTSWYFSFVMGMFKSIPLSFPILLGVYATLVSGAVVGSQVLKWYFSRQAGEHKHKPAAARK